MFVLCADTELAALALAIVLKLKLEFKLGKEASTNRDGVGVYDCANLFDRVV